MKKIIDWIYHGQSDESNRNLKEYVPEEILETSKNNMKNSSSFSLRSKKLFF